MIQRLIDYRLDGEALYIYDRTDYTQSVSFYNETTAPLIMTETANIVVIRNNDGILTHEVNSFEFNASEGCYVAIIDYNEEWGTDIYVDAFLIPRLINPANTSEDDVFPKLPYYTGYFCYAEDIKFGKGIFRCIRDDSDRTDPLTISVPVLPEDSPTDPNWEVFWKDSGLAEEMTISMFNDLLEQSRYSEYDTVQYISILHEGTGIEITENDPPDPITPGVSRTFLIEKLDCNKYHVTPNIDIEEAINITVYNEMTGKFVSNGLMSSPIPLPYTFNVPNDGIYSVHISYEVEGNELTEDYIFYEYCDLKSCFNKLVKSIYCNDIYCCDDCSTDVKYEQTRRIAELNKLTTLYTQLMLAIHGHQVFYLMHDYTGYEGYDKYIDSIKTLWETIQLVYKRCGDCDPNSDESNPCNCN